MAAKEGIWIVPSGGTDEFGDPQPSGAPEWVPGCVVLPRKSFESENGLIIQTGYEILIKPAPVGLEISATDAILVRSREWEVDGVPGVYPGGKLLQLFVKRAGS